MRRAFLLAFFNKKVYNNSVSGFRASRGGNSASQIKRNSARLGDGRKDEISLPQSHCRRRKNEGNMVDNESQEMYLETILRLGQKNGSVRSIDVAEALGYSKPSVSRAVSIMKKDEYITVRADGEINLTDAGRKKAENVLARHKALTEALVKMGLQQKAAEENACRVEHVITEEAFEAIRKYFGV